MQITVKKYDEQRSYLEYNDNSEVFTNAEYFVLDIGSGTYEDCLECGGYYANMTWRYIKEHNLDTVKYILLCCIPQQTAMYQFKFVYLDKDLNVQDSITNNNIVDYRAFHNRFEDLIVKEGFVYELEDTPSLKEITGRICYSPTADFGFVVNEKQIQYDDVLIYRDVDLSIFKEDYRDNLKRINAKDMMLKLHTNLWETGSSVSFMCKMIDENGNTIKDYQVGTGFTSIDEYAESIYQKEKDKIKAENNTKEEWKKEFESHVDNNDFIFSLPFSQVKSKADKLSFYDKPWD